MAQISKRTHGKDTFSEHDDIHVQRFEVGRAEIILFETSERNEIIVAEQLDLFASFLHLDIFRCQRMNRENLNASEEAFEVVEST